MDVSSLVSQLLIRFANGSSVAEITSGIVCGCLITMPNFFRHFAPKIASKLHSSNKSGSLHKLASIVPASSRKAAPQWHNRYDPASRHSQYLELGENNVWHSPAKAGEAEVNGSIPANAAWRDSKVSKSRVDLESGIVKTAKVDQYSRFPIS